jgi:hypothetical protein
MNFGVSMTKNLLAPIDKGLNKKIAKCWVLFSNGEENFNMLILAISVRKIFPRRYSQNYRAKKVRKNLSKNIGRT